MTIEVLRQLVIVAMTIIGKDERLPPNRHIVDAIVSAVWNDNRSPLTGSIAGDAVLMVEESYDESRWGWIWNGRILELHSCPVGDGGLAWGYWQLQTRQAIGCDAERSAGQWLAWAHASQHRCQFLPEAERLAELHSGTCSLGHVVSRFRWARSISRLAEIR